MILESGEEDSFEISLTDNLDNPILGKSIAVNDGLLDLCVSTDATDAFGKTSYRVLANKSAGQYPVQFSIELEGYSNKAQVNCEVEITPKPANFVICYASDEIPHTKKDSTIQNLENARDSLIKNNMDVPQEQIKVLFINDNIGVAGEYGVTLTGNSELPPYAHINYSSDCIGDGITLIYSDAKNINGNDIQFVPVHEYMHKILPLNNMYKFNDKAISDPEGLVNFCTYLITGIDCPFKKAFENIFLDSLKKQNEEYYSIFKSYDPLALFPPDYQSKEYSFWVPNEDILTKERKEIMYYALQYDFWKYYLGTNHDKQKPNSDNLKKLFDGNLNPSDADVRNWKALYLPDVPQMIFPPDNTTNIDDTLTIRWNSVDGIMKYHLQVSEGAISLKKFIFDSIIDGTSVKITNLKGNQTKYFWRVQAINIDSIGSFWSDTSSFTTKNDTSNINEYNIEKLELSITPNPFGIHSEILFSVNTLDPVTIYISNNLGIKINELVNNVYHAPGEYKIKFNANKLSPGCYFCTLKAGRQCKTVKFIVIK